MIGKGKAIAHTQASVAYGWNQEKEAVEVYRQGLIGENPKEISAEFHAIQAQNMHCTKNTLSFVISPTVSDGQRLKAEAYNKICQRFMKEMELGKRQAIAFIHKDKAHAHIHLYVNRIDYKGVAYNDSFIGKRSQKAAEQVAEKMRLTTVKQVQFEKTFLHQELRSEIRRRHELTLQHQKPNNFNQYIEGMGANGVKVHPTINKQGKLQGFRFEFNGVNLKGSEVHRSMSGGQIGKRIFSADQAIHKTLAPLQVAGKTIGLAPGLAQSIAKTLAKKVIKQAISKGIGI